MKATATDLHAKLLKKYHTVCTVMGLKKDEKEALISGYGVTSSKDLTTDQLSEIIDALNREPEVWRKRTMAAIGAWLRQINRVDNAEIIKGIACRAAKTENFNYIPVSRLRDVYYEFSKKAKTAQSAQMIMADEIQYLQASN